MPYYITDSASGCSGWATIKEDGEVIGCHTTKQAAIDQMVAVSIAEDMEPGGERADYDEEKRALPDNYRPALSEDVPQGRACGNCVFYDESNVQGDRAWCRRWDDYVRGDYYCNAWQPVEEQRQVELDVPQYIREAARRGLDYYGQGRGGDGLVARTIREARQMARGEISEDKVIRANAWGKRHLVDLEAPQNSNPDDDNFPGAGAVAFYLWGIDPLDPEPAMDWFEDAAELIRGEEDDMEDESDDMDDDEARARRLLVLERLSKLFLDK